MTTNTDADVRGALARLMPVFEKAMRDFAFTAEHAGEVAADMNTLRSALAAQPAAPSERWPGVTGKRMREVFEREQPMGMNAGSQPRDFHSFKVGMTEAYHEYAAWWNGHAAPSQPAAEPPSVTLQRCPTCNGMGHTGPLGACPTCHGFRSVAAPAPSAAAVGPKPMQLSIIRKWPDGFDDRLQAVWVDVVSFIPNVKLYDLQRVLAEFGFRMEVYEDATAPHPQPAPSEALADFLTQVRAAVEETRTKPGVAVKLPESVTAEIRKFMRDEPSAFDQIQWGEFKGLVSAAGRGE